MAERAGFSCAFLNGGGGLGAPMPRFALPRVHVTGAMNLGEFEAHVSGFIDHCGGGFWVPIKVQQRLSCHCDHKPSLFSRRQRTLASTAILEVVSHYASLEYLTACERHLFDTYLSRA